MNSFFCLALCFADAGPPQAGADHTGVQWVLPFDKARAAAAKRNRILLIKPIAGGSDAKGGW